MDDRRLRSFSLKVHSELSITKQDVKQVNSKLNQLPPKISRIEGTLTPQERMAFSVGDPEISTSPPPCTHYRKWNKGTA